MADREFSTFGREPDWAGLRTWLREHDAMTERQRTTGSSVLCVGCREWFVYPAQGLVIDAESRQPVYRCAGCAMAQAAGFEDWHAFRLASSRAAMRRAAERRGALR